MKAPSSEALAQEIAALRVNEICNMLFSMRYSHSKRREEEVFGRLEELEEEFLLLDLDLERFLLGARWAVSRLGTCRKNGQPRAHGGGRKKGGGK